MAAETCLVTSQSIHVGVLKFESGCEVNGWPGNMLAAVNVSALLFASGFFRDTSPQKRWELHSRRMMVLIPFFATSKQKAPQLLADTADFLTL